MLFKWRRLSKSPGTIYSRDSLMRPPKGLSQKWSLCEVVVLVKGCSPSNTQTDNVTKYRICYFLLIACKKNNKSELKTLQNDVLRISNGSRNLIVLIVNLHTKCKIINLEQC